MGTRAPQNGRTQTEKRSELGSRRTKGFRKAALTASFLTGVMVSGGVSAVAAGDVSTVAKPAEGSSDPTSYASNRRVAVARSGRVLVVHGLHLEGVQLKWRDPGEPWRKKTTGAVSDGTLLRDTGTGDWTASIATARDGDGKERAWVVWSGTSSTGAHRLEMRRLSRLGSAGGPRVGPVVSFAEPSGPEGTSGPSKVDLSFEKKPSGGYRGVLTWLEELGPNSFQIMAAWFTDLGTNRPTLHHRTVLSSETHYARASTLTPTPSGTAIVAKGAETKLRLWRHDADDPLGSWTQAPVGVSLNADSYPSAISLDNGDILAAVESNTTTNTVTVQRWQGDAAPTIDLTAEGYEEPTITTNGIQAWLVMVRSSDDHVISRKLTTSWAEQDVTEIGDAAGADPEWPNAPRHTGGKLRFVFKGPEYDDNQSSVLFSQRKV